MGSDDGGRQPGSLRERLRAGDGVLYRVPFIGHPISINEFHAHVLGVVTGALVTLGYRLGFEDIAFLAGAALVGYALFGRPFLQALPHDAQDVERTIALRTIKWEPWHFLGPFLLGIGGLLLVTGP